jgi:hypothetical protein
MTERIPGAQSTLAEKIFTLRKAAKSKRLALIFPALLCLSVAQLGAQTAEAPSATEVARKLGFDDGEIAKIQNGEIVRKDLKEGADSELAGVVAAFFKQPVGTLAEGALMGKFLDPSDPASQFHTWNPETPADEAFSGIALSDKEAGEVKNYSRAKAGSKLNLSEAEIAQFKKSKTDAASINAVLRATLKARYEAYRQSGLKGIAPYDRGGDDRSSPGDELRLAINETKPASRRQEYFEALLNYPANPVPEMQHRFFWFKQRVEDRPTFVLAHRAAVRIGENAALVTEEQYYVSHSYNANFFAGGCLAVEGGTIVFYVNRTFTDQVAGFGSGMKHSIGRGQMLSEVVSNLQKVREKLK